MSNVDDVKARLAHSETLLAGNKIYYQKYQRTLFATNYGKTWTNIEMDLIVADYRPTDRVLAEKLGRSMGAIRAMRFKIKKGEVNGST